MSCAEFQRRLDRDGPKQAGAAGRAHVAACPECTLALRAARELESLLEAPPAAAPVEFADRVMARVAETQSAARRASYRGVTNGGDLDSWWVDAAAQPATALALMLAALFVWQRDALWTLGVEIAAGRFRLLEPPPWLAWISHFQSPEVSATVSLALVPFVSWGAYVLTGHLLRPRGRRRIGPATA